MSSALDHILKSPSLPSLPAVAIDLLKLSKDQNATQADFVRTVQSDPAIAAKILQMANSSFFGVRTNVTTIQKSISMLGTRAVTSLALSFSIARQSVGENDISHYFTEYWQRSVLQAIACESMAKYQDEHSRSELFLAGLMLDIGRLAMLKVLGRQYGKILNRMNRFSPPLCECEQDAFEFDHTTAGAELLAFWGFPPSLVEGVRQHHRVDPVQGYDKELTETIKVTRVAAAVADYFYNERTSEALQAYETAAAENLGLDKAQALDLTELIAENFRESADMFDADAYDLPDTSDLMAEANRQLATLACEAEQSQASLAGEVESLRKQAINDPLTGVSNRAYFDDVLNKEIDLCRRNARSIGLLFLDIDHFKNLNDTHGHQFGDEVLKDVANAFTGQLRESDVLARYGGEEFVILARQPMEEGLQLLAERLRAAIEALSWTHEGSNVKSTVSIGVAYAQPKANDPEIAAELVKQADEAMYDAKHGGRNGVRYRSLCDSSVQAAGAAIDSRRFSRELVAQGVISDDDLEAVRDSLLPSSARVGELAVQLEWLGTDVVEEILAVQRNERGERRFCEIAIELGHMSSEQSNDLLAFQAEDGDVTLRLLIERGSVAPDTGADLLETYRKSIRGAVAV